jgi:hypothetical protein
MINNPNVQDTEIAVLLTTCNKYEPGEQVFRMQSLTGLKDNTNSINRVSISKNNILNKNVNNLPIGDVGIASAIKLKVPVEISRRYPLKFIPAGTRFIVSFTSGDITKPVIIGGEFYDNDDNT